MLKSIRINKKQIVLILLTPFIFITLELLVNIIFNTGVYFGTIAREVSEGTYCIKKS